MLRGLISMPLYLDVLDPDYVIANIGFRKFTNASKEMKLTVPKIQQIYDNYCSLPKW